MKNSLLQLAFLTSALSTATPEASAVVPNTHFVVIGVDGLGAQWIPKARMPNVQKLMARGAWTLHARGVMPTSSSPNWASMIMGAGPEQHGVTSNDWETNKFEFSPTRKGSGGMFPTIFGLLRQQSPDSVITCVHDWDGFGRLFERGAVDLVENRKGSTNTLARAIEVIAARKPTFMFIHFDDVDHAGHSKGWGSPEYFSALEDIDRLIGDIVAAIEKAGMMESTTILLTADHGGTAAGKHGGLTMAELEIPWIMAGPNTKKGYEIQIPVNTFDTAPTIARIFKLKTPEAWIGRPVMEALK